MYDLCDIGKGIPHFCKITKSITIIQCYPILNLLKETIMLCRTEGALNNTSGKVNYFLRNCHKTVKFAKIEFGKGTSCK